VGIGSDGILEVTTVTGTQAEIVIWNPDGTTAELSGNGTRIVARWLAGRTGSQEVTVWVGTRRILGRMRGGVTVETDVGEVVVSPLETIDVEGEQIELTPVSVGNPHAVVRRTADREELLRLGPRIEGHPRFPNRTNVQLVAVESTSALTVAVWERGVGETLSSGTSACAAAAAAIANGWCKSPITVHLPGGALTVAIDSGWNATLTGPAEEICRGSASREFLARLAAG